MAINRYLTKDEIQLMHQVYRCTSGCINERRKYFKRSLFDSDESGWISWIDAGISSLESPGCTKYSAIDRLRAIENELPKLGSTLVAAATAYATQIKERFMGDPVKITLPAQDSSITSGIRCALEGPLMHGLKVATADEGGTLLLEIVKNFFGDKFPEALRTEKGQIVAKMLAAGALKIAAANKLLPVDDAAIASVCDLQLEAGSRDLIQPLLNEMTPTLQKMVKLAPSTKTE